MGEYPILQFFTFDHLPDHLADVSRPFAELAEVIAAETDGDPETEVALRKLLEAKDGTVAAVVGRRLIAQDQADTPDPEPDDGLIAVTVRLTAEEVRARANADYEVPEVLNERPYTHAAVKFGDACRAIDLPAPKPPWKSPLDDLPDLTESQCRDAVLAAEGYPDSDMPWPQIGRALKAAGWTPEGEA